MIEIPHHFYTRVSGKPHSMRFVMKIFASISVVAILSAVIGCSSKNVSNLPLEIDANLSKLVLSNGTLSPVFDKDTTNYTVEVAYVVTSIIVTPTEDASTSTIEVNGTAVASGSATSAIDLPNTGININTISIVVTGSDKVTKKTYTINVTRTPISSNADLAGLALSAGTLSPSFASSTTSYTVEVPYAATTMTVTPTVAGVSATVKVNNDTVTSGLASSSISIPNSGSTVNTVMVLVTAQDGTTKTYIIQVMHAAISSNANLSNLTVSSGTLSPVFSSGTTSYTLSVNNSVTAVTLTPTAASTVASDIMVNTFHVISGVESSAINLNVGINNVTIIVTAQDTTTKSYTLTVTRAPYVKEVTLDTKGSYLYAGGTTVLTATVLPPDACQDVIWKSSNSAVATVSASTGLSATVTAVAAGTSTITVTPSSGGWMLYATTVIAVASTSSIVSGNTGTTGTPGYTTTYTLPTGTIFNTKQATADNITGIVFPTGTDDSTTATISTPFVMAETITTYQLWSTVYGWAVDHGYTFSNQGWMGTNHNCNEPYIAGGNKQPVTYLSWRDVMVWCNALTEYYNANNSLMADLSCVYYTDANYSTPLRTSTANQTVGFLVAGSQDEPYIKASTGSNISMESCTAKGFRLPTRNEYEFAARYRGSDSTNAILLNGVYWTKGNSASGATKEYTDYATSVASVFQYYYGGNSTGVWNTLAVKSRIANTLGLYDMSGNVKEWCFDLASVYNYDRVLRGGSFNDNADYMQVGRLFTSATNVALFDYGFRFARTK